jgi:hypothetical protein
MVNLVRIALHLIEDALRWVVPLLRSIESVQLDLDPEPASSYLDRAPISVRAP